MIAHQILLTVWEDIISFCSLNLPLDVMVPLVVSGISPFVNLCCLWTCGCWWIMLLYVLRVCCSLLLVRCLWKFKRICMKWVSCYYMWHFGSWWSIEHGRTWRCILALLILDQVMELDLWLLLAYDSYE